MGDVNLLEYLSKWEDASVQGYNDCAGWDERREVLFEGKYVAACIYVDIDKKKFNYCVWSEGNTHVYCSGYTGSYEVSKLIATVSYMRSRNLILNPYKVGEV